MASKGYKNSGDNEYNNRLHTLFYDTMTSQATNNKA